MRGERAARIALPLLGSEVAGGGAWEPGGSMASERAKWGVLGVSLTIAAVVSTWAAKRHFGEPPMIKMIDNSAEVFEMLDKGRRAPAEIPVLDPKVLIERSPWSEALAAKFFPSIEDRESEFSFDPIVGIRRAAGIDFRRKHREHPDGGFQIRTNSLGMRDDELIEDPELLLLFTGDSQTEGVCGIDESFVNLVEARLREDHPGRRIDAANAGLGGTSPWYYLDVLEASLPLEPDVFVPVFYGGNDFRGVIPLERFYRGRGRPKRRRVPEGSTAASDLPNSIGSQELGQIEYFEANPEDRQIAVDTWIAISMEMSRRCEAHGIEFRPAYLPPPLVTQGEPYAELIRKLERRAPTLLARISQSDELADPWIAFLAEAGIEVIDLRPPIAAADSRLFWTGDRHLNVEGQEIASRTLYDALAGVASEILQSKK